MPPKSKKEEKITKDETKKGNDEQIRAADQRLKTDSKPNEADFKVLLDGADGTINDKILAAQLIPIHASKFPKYKKQACNKIIKLLGDDDYRTKSESLRHLLEFKEDDKNAVYNALYKVLGDDNSTIQQQAADINSRCFKEDDEFRDSFISALSSQPAAVQTKMVEIIKDNYKLIKEEQLNDIIQVSLKIDPIAGLKLARTQSKVLTEEQKAAFGQPIIENLRSDFKTKDFDAVCTDTLIPLLENTRALDNTFPKSLLEVISEEVAPKFDRLLLPANLTVLKRLLERTFELSRYVPNDIILTNLYNQIFTSFPKNANQEVNLNFAIIERTLLAMAALSRRFTRTFSLLVGKHITCTGQPGENDGIPEDEGKYQDYKDRLEFLRDSAKEFGKNLKEQQERVRSNTILSLDERKEKLRKLSKGRTAVANAKKTAFLLLGKKPLLDPLPENPSWKDRKPKLGRNNQNNRKFNQGTKQKKFNNDRRNTNNNYNNNYNKRGRNNYNNNNNRSFRNNNRSRDFGRRK